MTERIKSFALFGTARAAIGAIMLIFTIGACALAWIGFVPNTYDTTNGAATYHEIGELPATTAAIAETLDIGTYGARLAAYSLAMASCLLIVAFFWQLFQINGSARHGDPFTRANASRVSRMGWLIIAPSLLDVDLLIDLARLNPPDSTQMVLLTLFATAGLSFLILARVFRAGIAMREDLEGTV